MSIQKNAVKINVYTIENSVYSVKLTEQNDARLDDAITNGGNRIMEFEGLYGEVMKIRADRIISSVTWDRASTDCYLEDEAYAAKERVVEEGNQ